MIVPAALLLAWIVFATAIVAVFSPRAPAAARLAGGHPQVAFEIATAEFAASGGTISAATMAHVLRSLPKEPMAAEPFFFQAASGEAGNAQAKTALLEAARRRNPRYRSARLMLVDQYIRQGRIDQASAEIAVLARLAPSARDVLISQLAALATLPQTRDLVAQTLASDPLLALVLEELARRDTDPDIVLRLAARQTHPPSGTQPWQQSLIGSLVRRGQIEQARLLWAQFGGISTQSLPPVYDADFAGLPGVPPFNWALQANEVGSAERARGGGLAVDYYGRGSGELASQLLLLSPGRYRLSFQVEGSANAQGSHLAWRLVCFGASEPQLSKAIIATSAPRRIEADFVVPPSKCGAQWLRLEGVSAEFPTTQSVEIRALRLQRAGAVS